MKEAWKKTYTFLGFYIFLSREPVRGGINIVHNLAFRPRWFALSFCWVLFIPGKKPR